MESPTHQYQFHQDITSYHVLVHYLCIDCYFLYCLLSIDVEPESEILPEAEDSQFDPSQQGKQPLIDHVDKNPFPSHSRLCMFRMLP